MYVATSWDDGLTSDRRLLTILERWGVRATFALAPQRHSLTVQPNDHRFPGRYGQLLPQSELIIYRDQDICSHTAHHVDASLCESNQLRMELHDSKAWLEDRFQREVPGIIWPYGVSTPQAIATAQACGYRYGRTTPAPERKWAGQKWDIVPFSWQTSLAELLEYPHRCVALSGHTYEFRTEADWDYVGRFYREASQTSRCQLVTLSELAEILS